MILHFLRRRFQQRLFITIILLILLFVSLLTVHYQKPEYSEIIGNHVTYYHDKVKDYANDIKIFDNDNLAKKQMEILEILNKPAFEQTELEEEEEKEPNRKELIRSFHKQYKQIFTKPITEPKKVKLTFKSKEDKATPYQLANATFVSLVRNSELRQVLSTIKQLEETFNHKYNYPYVFLNDETFTDKFKSEIYKNLPNSKVEFGVIPRTSWNKPSFIDLEREEKGIEFLKNAGVGYSEMLSYHNMCRYYSLGFYNHEIMQKYRYYWRVEPGVRYYCEIEYDIFKFMNDNGKIYGFVISLYDSPESVQNLWPETLNFLQKNDNYKFLNKNCAHSWLRENLQNPGNYLKANGYSTCHFWSNFEIADMDFYRSKAYSSWVEHLDQSGGFYYERWGDAPVHSVGVGLFADKKDIHWFRDIGYFHPPYFNAPLREEGKCVKSMPIAGKFSTGGLEDQNCLVNWVNMAMENDPY